MTPWRHLFRTTPWRHHPFRGRNHQSANSMLRDAPVIALISYVTAVTYAIAFPSLAPYLESLELLNSTSPHGTTQRSNGTSPFLGITVSSYSASKVVFAPLTGRFTSRFGVQPALYASSALIISGSLGYALASNPEEVIAARILLGMSSCSSTVCRAWVSTQRIGGSQGRVKLTSMVSSATSNIATPCAVHTCYTFSS